MSLKKCSKCQKPFECCNETPGCWCEDVFIDMKTLEELKAKYDNCLCKECLKGYEREKVNTE